MASEQKSQLVTANEVLSDLHPSVTTEDRRAAIQDLNYSEFTVIQYLKGRGKNLDTAMKLLGFFRKRIGDREKALA